MATEIRQLYDTTTEDSVNIMPITTFGAVRDNEGNSLEDVLGDIDIILDSIITQQNAI